jgi:prophage regulatory protein
MIAKDIHTNKLPLAIRIIRHTDVRQKLSVSEAKLFDMIAKGLFPKPFLLIPGGRSVGWLESDVDKWILERKQALKEATA